MATIPFLVTKTSQEGLLQYYGQCTNMMNEQYNIRTMMETIDRQYLREVDLTTEETRARTRNLHQYDPTKFRNVIVPVVMPQVESAVAYQASVFLTGVPIFGVVASPQFMNAARQMEAVIADQATKGAWSKNFMMAFRDGFKYNFFGIECDWCTITTPAIETQLGKEGKARNAVWEGNRIRRRDPYNLIWDTRYWPTDVHTRGEFAGYVELLSRTELKQFIESTNAKQVQNIVPALESQYGGGQLNSAYSSYYIPTLNPHALIASDSYLRTTNWMAWAGLIAEGKASKINYSNIYEKATIYARIIPSDFGMRVPQPNTPQIWKLIFINRQVLLVAERQTNAHNLLPIIFGQPNENGLGYQDKSVAENAVPFQNVSSALMNANIAARRRAISDRGFYDPSRINSADINSDNPAAKIPVRPAAYGKPVSEAYAASPFRDDQSVNNVQEMQMVATMADIANGQNRAKQGQFTKGNRTKFEFQDIMGNANARDQMVAIGIEENTMTPIKEIIKINILQYQPQSTLLDRNKKQLLEVDPVALRNAVMEFKVSDGLVPAEKLISGEELATTLQVLGSSPEIAASYNIGPLFSYLMKTRGADLEPFEKTPEQIEYEKAVGAWQNTVIQLMKQNPEVKQEQLPPQPLPQQYNYNPAQQGQEMSQEQSA